jgi:hypothetical protein
MFSRRARPSTALASLAFFVAASAGCGAPGGAARASEIDRRFDVLSAELSAELDRRDPSHARHLGRHAFDGKLQSFAPAAIASDRAFTEAALTSLSRIDARALSADRALDHAILVHELRLRAFGFDELDAPHKRPSFYEDLFDVSSYVERPYDKPEVRMARLVEHEERALAETHFVRENLVLPLPKTFATVGGKNLLGFADYLRKDVVGAFVGVGDAPLRARFEKANAALATEAERLGRWLRDEVAPAGDDSFALGATRFAKLLEVQEGWTGSLDALSTMAEENLAANRRAYEALAATVHDERPPIDHLIAEASTLSREAEGFVRSHHLLSVPAEVSLTVRESPPFERWNSAFLDMSGPFDPYQSAFYYISPPDPTWSKAEQEGYVPTRGVLLSTTVHEVWPGHFLQGLFQRRAPTDVQKSSWSYSFGEGWAHYAEQMMLDEGFFADDPRARLGQLADALLRNCRFVGAIALHARGASVASVAERFEKDCHQDVATAREQAERGTFDPGYFAYTFGKLQILALRETAQRRLGPRFSLQRFHDALLAHGAPPVELIRERVLADLERATR